MTTWEGDYMKSVVHLMGALAENHNVLFVNYPFTWKDIIMSWFGKGNCPTKKLLGLNSRLSEVRYKRNTLHHLTLPPILPVNWINNSDIHDFLMRLQMKWISRIIRRYSRKLGQTSPAVINAFNPVHGSFLTGKLNESEIIYYCYDEINAAAWASKHGGRLEQTFAKKADSVVVSSSELLTTKSKYNAHINLVKNGVDFELFHQAYLEVKKSERKVIGYLGSIDDRLDFNLLQKTISWFKDYDFLFVGRIVDQTGHKSLSTFPNVKFLGAQSPEKLPSILRGIDLGLIPFVKNDFTKSIYPLKINEYLAAGIPVVTTNFADLSEFIDEVAITRNETQFLEAIDFELVANSSVKIEARIRKARENDWSTRVQQFETILEKY